MQPLIATSITLFAGLMMTRVFKLFHLNFPDVTAFLIAGLILGPYALGSVFGHGIGFSSFEEVEAMSVLTNAALGFIAFSIGSEFRLSEIKDIGKTAVVIGILQAVAATVLVDAALIALHFILGEEVLPITAVITLGAIASATAPAATLMVVRQYKAKGPVTSLLLPIVALDDAVGLVLFAVSFGVARAIQSGTLDVITIVVNPLVEIICSILLGAALGFLMSQVEKLFYSNSNRVAMTISFVFLTISLASMEFGIGEIKISFSSLLVCMMLGTVFCNASRFSDDIFTRANKWTTPLFAVFFVLSGAELDLGVLRYGSVILIGAVYIIVRMAGKYCGARFSSKMMGCSDTIVKYLGITLFPQAGVALGMVRSAAAFGGEEAALIRNVVLFGVLVYELVGPSLTRMALTAAGEIAPTPEEKKSRTRFTAR